MPFNILAFFMPFLIQLLRRPIFPLKQLFSNPLSQTKRMASTMQKAIKLRSVFAEGKGASMGAWQTLPGNNVSRAIANCGVDWIVVDCEHGNIDDAAMHEAVPTIAACGVSPIVRIPDNQGWMVKRKCFRRK